MCKYANATGARRPSKGKSTAPVACAEIFQRGGGRFFEKFWKFCVYFFLGRPIWFFELTENIIRTLFCQKNSSLQAIFSKKNRPKTSLWALFGKLWPKKIASPSARYWTALRVEKVYFLWNSLGSLSSDDISTCGAHFQTRAEFAAKLGTNMSWRRDTIQIKHRRDANVGKHEHGPGEQNFHNQICRRKDIKWGNHTGVETEKTASDWWRIDGRTKYPDSEYCSRQHWGSKNSRLSDTDTPMRCRLTLRAFSIH